MQYAYDIQIRILLMSKILEEAFIQLMKPQTAT